MRLATVITAAALAVTPIAPTAGEPSPPAIIPGKARELAERGRAFHDSGDYDHAIAAYKEAYVIAPSPGLLFNLAQAYRLRGSCDDALMMYRRYLETGPSPEGRTIAKGHLDNVERCARKQGLTIPIDSQLAHLAVLPPPASIGATSRPASRGQPSKDVGVGLTIAGSVAMSVALYYGFKAHDASAAVEDAYARGAKWQDVQAIDRRGQHSALMAKGFGIGGGLAVASGVTLYLLGKRAERTTPIAVLPSKHAAEVSLAWRF
jgi:tetratricopeptide (TPR) repeat protein